MRHALDKTITAGAAVMIIATIVLPWAWTEIKRARREQPRPQYAAAA